MKEKTSVCIVEDSAAFSEWLHKDLSVFNELEISGVADTVEGAYHLIKQKKPDIVVLDLWLKEGSAFELLESIREIPEKPAVYIFTNYPWPTLKKKCIEMGAVGFFEKSSEYFNLIDTLRTFRKEQ